MINRYGGTKFWDDLADKFHEKLKADYYLRSFFERRCPIHAKAINLNIFRAGFGHEARFYADAIKEAHEGRGITTEQFIRFTNCLRNTLIEEGVEESDIHLILERVSSYSTHVAEDSDDNY